MPLLDIDPLTYLHAGHARVIERLQALTDPNVSTTIITKIELIRGRMDFVLKAAIALAHRATLVTRNVWHFNQVAGLTVINWID